MNIEENNCTWCWPKLLENYVSSFLFSRLSWQTPFFWEAIYLDSEEHRYGNGIFAVKTYHLGCNQVIILTENIIITSDNKFYT